MICGAGGGEEEAGGEGVERRDDVTAGCTRQAVWSRESVPTAETDMQHSRGAANTSTHKAGMQARRAGCQEVGCRTSLWSDTGRMLKAITSWLLPAEESWW